ncbi:hypothetical protein MMC25_000258 [Agyrium rufum]|nr:hypothetical protein [Agyrium rufum]
MAFVAVGYGSLWPFNRQPRKTGAKRSGTCMISISLILASEDPTWERRLLEGSLDFESENVDDNALREVAENFCRTRDGTPGSPLWIFVSTTKIAPGNIVITASDGLWGSVTNEQAAELVDMWPGKEAEERFSGSVDYGIRNERAASAASGHS